MTVRFLLSREYEGNFLCANAQIVKLAFHDAALSSSVVLASHENPGGKKVLASISYTTDWKETENQSQLRPIL